MTLTATPQPATGYVRVVATPPAGSTLTRLARIDRNGRTTWTGYDLTNAIGTILGSFNDMLCAMIGPIEYVAQWTATTGGAVTYESVTTALDLEGALPRLYRLAWDVPSSYAGALGFPSRAAYTEHLTILDHGDADDEVTRLHSRGAGPRVVSIPSPVSVRTGSIQLWADTWADAAGIRDELTRHPMQYLRVPDAARMDHALIVESVTIDADELAWTVTASYRDPRETIRISTAGGYPHYRELQDWPNKTLEDIAESCVNLADMW